MMVKYRAKTPWWLKRIFPNDLVWRIDTDSQPTVYLTFDDGPHPNITPWVLDALDHYDAKATFFCVGNNVTKFPGVYDELLKRGHATANHTYNHMNGWKQRTDVYMDNIDKAGKYIKSNLFRPPYGKIKRAQIRRMRQVFPNYKIIMWDVLSADFDRSITPEQCAENVLSNITPGSIVLMHDSEKAWERMSHALPHILEYCRSNGWQMKAIPNR